MTDAQKFLHDTTEGFKIGKASSHATNEEDERFPGSLSHYHFCADYMGWRRDKCALLFKICYCWLAE